MSLSCFDFGERMLSVEEARAAALELVAAPLAEEWCPLAALCGRVLAQPVASPIDVPQNTNAAMDGIALAWPAEDAARPETWPLVGEVLAGHCREAALSAGECVTIMTGAPLPPGADTVIMREQLEFEGSRVRVHHAESVRRGQHVRRAGEDIARGVTALDAGTRVGAAELGLLASLGLSGAAVHRRPRVALFSTGDEVTAPGEALPPAGIFDANRFSLRGLLIEQGAELQDLGILPDDRGALVAALAAAAEEADVVITSGGVSVGDADEVRQALAEVGELGFWKIAIRPGRPLACGRLGSSHTPFFGLPGNPVAAMVTFLQFVAPVLGRLQGRRELAAARLTARCEATLPSRVGRVDFLRGVLYCDPEGQLWVRSTGHQGSGILSSMVAANCLIEIAAECDGVACGEAVIVQPLADIFRG
ncbi:molybdopterin molybdenumtransferase MoeA [Halomonas campisalis]|uniref:Molybdopterin molybdenumtransferase n=1 Tax=Billgrantia campisalis TaxID=74661 RepID=A0ABS9PB96_9GAMM|nr:gephyrin-like molybdotransferase Glp [Halomonas campisalis]MCG6659048.1 molybdopterin molybdenumtransferase MoeA [Halomonas campisalis]MDR5863769.1 molybdopterin-binding protein [Halomonas campisalis]